MENEKEKQRTEGETEAKELQREFPGPETSSSNSLQGLDSASNPISQKFLSFMGQMIRQRYECTGRQEENEMKHYHKVTALLGPPGGGRLRARASISTTAQFL